MATAVDDPAQRLSRAGAGPLYRRSGNAGSTRPVCHAAALPDAVERRRDAVCRGDRRRHDRAHIALGPGGGRAGERLSRRARTPARAASSPSTWAAPAADIAFIEGGAPLEVTEGGDRAPAARRARARHDDDLGRRRLDRLDRPRRLSRTSARRAPAPIPARRATDAAADSPTVTDADLVCGYLNPDYFLGGTQKLDVAAAHAALEANIAAPMRMDIMAERPPASSASSTCAWPTRCACSRRSAASICADFTLLPFGGAGAVHAAAVAEELGMRRILVPRASRRVLGARPPLHRRAARLHPLGARRARPARPPRMPRSMFRQLEPKAATSSPPKG